MMRKSCASLVTLMVAVGCGGEPSDDSATTVAATDGAQMGDETGSEDPDSDDSADSGSSGGADPAPMTTTGVEPEGGSSSGAGESTGDAGDDSTTTGEPADTDDPGMSFHPEFAWFADFVREKCVSCHDMGQNGNLVLPSQDMTNEEVIMAIDGGVATTGLKFIEPFDPPQSQMYIMISNEFGEQFPQETIDRVADWINLGAPYYE